MVDISSFTYALKKLCVLQLRQAAATFLPLDASRLADEKHDDDHATLEILVERIENVESLLATAGSRASPRFFVAYEIFGLQPHTTKLVTSNAQTQKREFTIDDRRSWTLPIGTSLHEYLKAEVWRRRRYFRLGSQKYAMISGVEFCAHRRAFA